MRLLIFFFFVLESVCNAQESKLRTWEAINGNKVEAEFVSNSGGQIILKMKTGKIFKIPLNKLSKTDQKFLKEKFSPTEPTKREVPVNSNLKQSEEVLIDSDLWYVVEDGTVRIIENRSGLAGLSNPETRLPKTIDGKPITSIGPKAYAGSGQKVFIIPDTVTDIGEAAFANCYDLEEVKIGKNVTSIGKGAFRFSMPLKSITIPGSVVNIGEEAFFSCRTLADITLNEGVTTIGEKAFVNTYVKEITIPKSIKSLGKDAFYSCARLTTVIFLGDAPEEVGRVFSGRVIIYRKADAKDWGETWGGKPVKLISEKP